MDRHRNARFPGHGANLFQKAKQIIAQRLRGDPVISVKRGLKPVKGRRVGYAPRQTRKYIARQLVRMGLMNFRYLVLKLTLSTPLKKIRARVLAEAGGNTVQIGALTGQESLSEIERYIRGLNKGKALSGTETEQEVAVSATKIPNQPKKTVESCALMSVFDFSDTM